MLFCYEQLIEKGANGVVHDFTDIRVFPIGLSRSHVVR